MKKYFPNMAVLLCILLFIGLGQNSQSDFMHQTIRIANELISELIMVFIGITVGLFIKNFLHTMVGAVVITIGTLLLIRFNVFQNFSNEFVIAEFLVIMGFASISNLHHIQRPKLG